MQIDNDKCRREARLSGSRLDFCMPRGNSRSSRTVDSHGNTLTPISPQSNNNSSPSEEDNPKLTTCLTAAGKYLKSQIHKCYDAFRIVYTFSGHATSSVNGSLTERKFIH